jgi:hypothetical protein
VITSGGKRNPAKLDLNAGTRRERRRIDQACLILLFTDATDPSQLNWGYDEAPRGAGKYQRTAIVITSGGKRNPVKLDLDADTRRERRRIDQACLILLSTDATVPPRFVCCVTATSPDMLQIDWRR